MSVYRGVPSFGAGVRTIPAAPIRLDGVMSEISSCVHSRPAGAAGAGTKRGCCGTSRAALGCLLDDPAPLPVRRTPKSKSAGAGRSCCCVGKDRAVAGVAVDSGGCPVGVAAPVPCGNFTINGCTIAGLTAGFCSTGCVAAGLAASCGAGTPSAPPQAGAASIEGAAANAGWTAAVARVPGNDAGCAPSATFAAVDDDALHEATKKWFGRGDA